MNEQDLRFVVARQAGRLAQIINESIALAQGSKSLSTRVSRFDLARAKFLEVQALAKTHTFISLPNLGEIASALEAIGRDIEASKQQAAASEPRLRSTPRMAATPQVGSSNAFEHTPLRDLAFSVVDLETTGLSAKAGARIVEIAIVRVEPGEAPRVVFETLVNPQGPVHCTEIHGIDDDDVVGAPIFADIAGDAVAALQGTLVGAFNASFDMGFLSAEFARARVGDLRTPPPHVCLMWLRPLLQVGRRCSLAVARSEHGIPPGSHRASDDAMACALMWPSYVEQAERVGIRTLGDLVAAGTHKYLSTLRYPFYGADDLKPLRRGTVRLKARPAAIIAGDTSGGRAGVRDYWKAVIDVLVDGTIDEVELAMLHRLQRERLLREDQIRAVHARIYAERLLELAADDALTDPEIASLATLRHGLGTIGWAP